MDQSSHQAKDLMDILSDCLHLKIKSVYGEDVELVRFLFDSESGEFAYEVVVDGESKYGDVDLSSLGKCKLSPDVKVSGHSFTAEHQVTFADSVVRNERPRMNTKKEKKKIEDIMEKQGSDIDLRDILDWV
jgi:hypothetical protein